MATSIVNLMVNRRIAKTLGYSAVELKLLSSNIILTSNTIV